jgi:hypothetical protein
MNDRPVHPLRLAPRELILDGLLRRRGFRKNDDARRVAIDAMDDERRAPAAGTEMIGKQAECRRRRLACRDRSRGAASKRHREKPSRFIDHEQRFIFVKNLQATRLERALAPPTAWPVDPDPSQRRLMSAASPRRVRKLRHR